MLMNQFAPLVKGARGRMGEGVNKKELKDKRKNYKMRS
jgi:hypothetical protein